jgi:hypothetical protein
MPYTTLVSGTTITATWANASVRDQVITPFASVAARDSAITVPVNGMYVTTTDTGTLWRYNGAKWLCEYAPVTVKPGDQGFTSTTTLSSDGQLNFPVEANSSYWFEFNVLWLAPPTPGYKFAIIFPAGGRIDCSRVTKDNSGVALLDVLQNPASGFVTNCNSASGGNFGQANLAGMYIGVGTAGSVTWQAAQSVSNATPSQTLRGSSVAWRQIS